MYPSWYWLLKIGSVYTLDGTVMVEEYTALGPGESVTWTEKFSFSSFGNITTRTKCWKHFLKFSLMECQAELYGFKNTYI